MPCDSHLLLSSSLGDDVVIVIILGLKEAVSCCR